MKREKYYEKREKSELEKTREEIIKREKSREFGYIRPAHFTNLVGYLRAGQISLRDLIEILNYRLITRDDMIKIWRKNQGNLRGKLAGKIVVEGLLSYICFDSEEQKQRVVKKRLAERR